MPGEDESFRKFFDDFFGAMPDREYKRVGLGSGVIINKEGFILTNEHVIDEADKITVTLSDGREFKAEIKGQDPRSDLAVIKINSKNLPVANLGDSDNIRIGQWAVAIGNPYSFAMQNPEPTVTTGVISALHRSLGRSLSLGQRDYNDLIQTDAAINPGNSGGPLVNLRGEVVGINVAIFSTSGGYQGIGFAIPINSAKRIIARLIEGKKIAYGWLGITVQDLNEDLARHFGLSDKNGVLVVKVLEDSPGLHSGMKEGDIIERIDNTAINNVRELLNSVGKIEIGRRIKITVIRDKKPIALDAVIGERPQSIEEKATEEGQAKAGNWRGMSVENLDSEFANRFRTKEKQGVVVTDVEPGSSADEAGLAAGDIILAVNKQAVKNISDYEKISKNLRGSVLVRTARGFFLLKEQSEKK
jgi:serine protease Do